jgi:NitT/TauT family transport system substrate-binding protein
MKIIKNLLLLVFFILVFNPVIAKERNLNIGLLKFGSVNWEIDILEHNELDKKNDFLIKKTFFSTKNAAAIALQGKAVDIIVTDWLWVSRQKGLGRNYVFFPHSMTVGGIMVKHDSEIIDIKDLENKKLGIAGSSIDKSWLLFRAYSNKKINKDPKKFLKPVYAAPPLLNEFIERNEIDAVLNYWHYNAKLQYKGYRELISIESILKNLGIKTKIPAIGWVFDERFGKENKDLINNFLRASNEAKKIMLSSDNEWERIFPLTRAKDRTMLINLRDAYRGGIPLTFGNNEIEETKKIYKILAKYGGRDLVGTNNELSPDIFWTVN